MAYVYITGDHETATCPKCNVMHSVPKSLYDTAKARAGSIDVFCPHGHSWVFTPKETLTREETLRLERDRLKQQLAFKDDEIERQHKEKENERNRRIALKGVLTKTKNRIAAGVCPCFNRTFENLARHMTTQHKGFASEEPEEQKSPQTEHGDEDQVVDNPSEPAATLPPKSTQGKACSVDGCEGAIFARGLCSKHYQRQRRDDRAA